MIVNDTKYVEFFKSNPKAAYELELIIMVVKPHSKVDSSAGV
jgi:hypothetical protein